MTKNNNHRNDPVYIEWHKNAVDQALQWHAHLISEITTWGIETMKHIALIALSGLAGVFALMSTSTTINKSIAVNAAIMFAVASALCVAGLYAAYVDRCISAVHQNKYIGKLYRYETTSPEDHAKPRYAIWAGRIADTLGWLAAIAVVFGGLMFFKAIDLQK